MLRPKTAKKTILLLLTCCAMLCAYGPCSPTTCPSEATQGPEQGCWYELSSQRQFVSVNHGELRVKVEPTSQVRNAAARPPLYHFAFIQDPQEQVTQTARQRVGSWKLAIRPRDQVHLRQDLTLSWHLRAPRPSLRRSETLRLAVTWLRQGKRYYRVLPGRYDLNHHRVHARLTSQALSQPHAYLVPIRTRSNSDVTRQTSTWRGSPSTMFNVATASP